MAKDKNIYIYHIPGVKIGVTRNIFSRVTKQQGYKPGEYEILETSEDIEFISKREKELQRLHGYESDFNSYSNLSKQNKQKPGMKINITAATTTFPVPLEKLEDYLTDNLGFKFKTLHREHILDDLTAEWIVKNARASHFNPLRSYVYNKSLGAFDEENMTEKEFRSDVEKIKVRSEKPTGQRKKEHVNSVFTRIRLWATERGLYKSGDSKTQLVKLTEEVGELARAILKRDKAEIKDGIGDAIVVLTNLAYLEDFTVEECIEAAYEEIKDRKGGMDNGTFKKETL